MYIYIYTYMSVYVQSHTYMFACLCAIIRMIVGLIVD